MTNYRRSNEAQRNDIDLLVAIRKELEADVRTFKAAKAHVEQAYNILLFTSKFVNERVSFGTDHTRFELDRAAKNLHDSIEFITKANIDNYVSNIAAFMSELEVQNLKEKHIENFTD
jgi:hypothetical protein